MRAGSASNLMSPIHIQLRMTGEGFPAVLVQRALFWLFLVLATWKAKGFAFHTSFPYVFRAPNSISGTWKHPTYWGWDSPLPTEVGIHVVCIAQSLDSPGPLSKHHGWCLLQHVPMALVTTELAPGGGWEINVSRPCSRVHSFPAGPASWPPGSLALSLSSHLLSCSAQARSGNL